MAGRPAERPTRTDAAETQLTAAPRVYDVAIVGLGPVGQTLGLLLAQRGHNVVVVEKQPNPYPLPRAVHYDPDVSRLLDGLGLADFMAEFASPTASYEWQTADRQTMLRFDYSAAGNQGWPESSMFNQPALEERLRTRGADFPDLKVYRGTEVVGFDQQDGLVELRVTGRTLKQRTLRAKYAVGADGSNSFVRQYMNTAVKDLGFFYDWLIVDLLPTDGRVWEPDNLQVCDPDRPTTTVSAGPGRRRFEFMRMPGDDLTVFDTDEFAWQLLAPWGVTPETATLERRAIYRFQAKWVENWRDGRVFLAGDAAHQMPPFYGQGLVSGIRDSANLAWKLDLVLNGVAGDALLDTYTTERAAHVQFALGMSVELGRVICQTDPAAVAERDAHFLANGPLPQDVLPPVPPERLGPGAFPQTDPTLSPVAGLISVQGRVGHAAGTVDLLDRSTFGRFTVLLDGRAVDDDTAAVLANLLPDGLPALVVRVLPKGSAPTGGSSSVLTVTDEDDRYLPELAARGQIAQLIRPDFFIYGGAADQDELSGLVRSLPDALHLTVPAKTSGAA
ncbi:bifunctional 3-(3-hydroxy-phenyl)propionate/3-hydroxycinnamic acid hydroxylase [Arthrobacter sp. NPDC089319]|uniref:bifunctional 3-(3-hydroxy-phenyl)propionate/3-hydroxycinnamic acid hydroxylase MhpA n=1 Tax=Arthrobacter sp. NPDC089319 TaxID=3155915 RepID=UPI00341C8FF9